MVMSCDGNFDVLGDTPKEPVKVETLLLKICHKKRKDSANPVMSVSYLSSSTFVSVI